MPGHADKTSVSRSCPTRSRPVDGLRLTVATSSSVRGFALPMFDGIAKHPYTTRDAAQVDGGLDK
jgi:hypothetical protein